MNVHTENLSTFRPEIVHQPQVLCLGEILFDRLADHPAKTVAEVTHWHSYPGGAPANVACALERLGTRAGFVGCVGQDEPGDNLIQVLAEIGVNQQGIQRHPQAPTRLVDVLHNHQGDRRFAGFSGRSSHSFADNFLDPEALPPDLFTPGSLLVTGTLGLASGTTPQAIDRAINLTQAQGGQVVVDVNWRPMFWPNPDQALSPIKTLLQRADWIKLTDEEADLLFQTQDLPTIQRHLPQVQGILLTAGPQGCHYWIHGEVGFQPAFRVQTVDTTGAGDSFLAGFLHQYLQYLAQPAATTKDPQSWVTYASAVGALTTLKSGAIAAQPKADEVRQFLQSYQ